MTSISYLFMDDPQETPVFTDRQGSEITVATLAPEGGADWDDFVSGHPRGTLYHLSGWRRIIEETYGHPAYYLTARRGDGVGERIIGALPLIYLKHFLFGNRLISIPFFDQAGVLADNPQVAEALLGKAIILGRELKVEVVELRQKYLLLGPNRYLGQTAPARTVRSHKVGMELDLPGSADELWQSFKAKLRSQIKKPLKEKFEVRTGGVELLDSFYQVFAVNMRDLGSPVHSKEMVRAVLRTFKEQAAIIMIFNEEQPVAGGLVVGHGQVLANPWASALRSVSSSSPNMLLYWAMLEYGCKHGYSVFDFGRSTPMGGTYRFKKQWGAKEKPLFWESIHLNGTPITTGADNGRMRMAVNCWRKLPVPISKLLGPMIRKHIDL